MFLDDEQAATGFAVRGGKEADLPDLVLLENECFDAWYYRDHRFGEPQFRTYIRRTGSVFLVVEWQSSVVGYVAGSVSTRRSGAAARIDSLAVLPAFRQKGVGQRLLSHFLQAARENGCRTVTLEAAVANEAAIRFFITHGFRRIRRLPSYYGGGVDGVRMKHDLQSERAAA